MPAEQRIAVTATHQSVDPVLGLDFEHSAGRQFVKEDSTLNLRLNDVPVDLVAQMLIRGEHRGDEFDRFRH